MNYIKIYDRIIQNALKRNNLEGYHEKHHIIPRCIGGSDSEENIVKLKAKEHFLAHRLLAKIHPDNNDLNLCVFLMTKNPQNGGVVTSRVYENLRKRYSKINSENVKKRMSTKEYRERNSRNTKKCWEDPKYRENMRNKVERYYREVSRPWTNKNGSEVPRFVWVHAPILKTLQESKNKISRVDFAKYFLNDSYHSPIQTMTKMLKNGWDPLKDDKWLMEFKEEYEKLIRNDETLTIVESLNCRTIGIPWKFAPKDRKHLWGLSQDLLEFMRDTGMGYSNFGNLHTNGQSKGVLQYMSKFIKQGWIPTEDPLWLFEFKNRPQQ